MRDRYFGKTWIFKAQAFIFFPIGSFSILMAILFGTGMMKDVHGKVRTDGVVPMLIIGTLLLVVAVVAVLNIIALRGPVIRCFREGIEFNLVGFSSAREVFMPRFFHLLWVLVTGEAFHQPIGQMLWKDFKGAKVIGIPAMYILEIEGNIKIFDTDKVISGYDFKEALLIDPPQAVADELKQIARDGVRRKSLPSWDEEV